jgi:glutaredoxin
MGMRTNPMARFILYFQPDCHLCDEAESLLHASGLAEAYQKVDIESDLELLKQYGIHVPVLKRKDNQQELFWPFNQADVSAFLELKR